MTYSHAHDRSTSRQIRTVLLATDNKHSIFAETAESQIRPFAYSAYGQQSAQQPPATGLGFNGELREARLGWYFLGNGYRAYNPILMRFHSPDNWSPFGRGGLNAYTYCVGDPVNFSDPMGHMKQSIFSRFRRSATSGASNSSNLPALNASVTARATPNVYVSHPTASSFGAAPITSPTQIQSHRPVNSTTSNRELHPGRSPSSTSTPALVPFDEFFNGPANSTSPPTGRSTSSRPNHTSTSGHASADNWRTIWRSEHSTSVINDTGGQVGIVHSSSIRPPPRPERYLENGVVIGRDGVQRISVSNIQRALRGEPPLHPRRSNNHVRRS